MVLLALLTLAVSAFLAFSLVVVSLVEAPWPILLGGLLLALYGIQRLSTQSQLMAAAAELEQIQQQNAERRPRAAQTASKRSANQPAAGQAAMGQRAKSQAVNNQTDSPSEAASSAGKEMLYRGIRYRQQPPTPPTADVQAEIVYRGCKVKQPNSKRTTS